MFGPEDRFFNRFAAMARLSPLMPAICGETKLQPVYVGDVADAVMAALGRLDAAGTTYALGGRASGRSANCSTTCCSRRGATGG